VRTARHRRPTSLLVPALAAAAGLVLPVECAGCGQPDVPLCMRCLRSVLGPGRAVQDITGQTPRWWVGTGVPLHAVAPYQGQVRAALVQWKDEGRADLTTVVGAALARSLASCLQTTSSRAQAFPVLVVPAPSARSRIRRRGGDLVAQAGRRAAATCSPRAASALEAPTPGRPPLVLAPVLRQARAVVDQAGLGWRGRLENVSGRIRCDPRVRGRTVVLVDDVVTTGATLAEAVRALRAAGAEVIGAATVAATPLSVVNLRGCDPVD